MVVYAAVGFLFYGGFTAGVIASEAKQSHMIAVRDCFVATLLAKTVEG